MNVKNLNKKIDEIFKQIGEFGPYQLTLFFLIGITAFIPAIVGYSYSFYGATPDFRCKIPFITNDSFEVMNEWHQFEIDKYIPLAKEESINNPYDKCFIKVYYYNDSNHNNNNNNNNNFTLEKCDSWVYSKKYFNSTLISDWNLVCDKTPRKTLFSTLYFVGTYGVLLNGFLSDRYNKITNVFNY
jgi:MFS transporter, OCT family, solute carrier family 22 (organic cation transporter), member 4/5